MKKSMRERAGDMLAELIVMLLVNIGAVLICFAIMLMLNPFIGEISARDNGSARSVEIFRSVLCVLIFYVMRALLGYHNHVDRNRYVTSGRSDGYFRSLLSHITDRTPSEALACLLFCLPIHIVISFYPDIDYLPTLFLPQYSLITLTGSVLVSYIVNILCYTVFVMLITPLFHVIWDKKRLHRD